LYFEKPLVKILRTGFDSQTTLKHWTPRLQYEQAASTENVRLHWLVGVARGLLWRWTRLEEIIHIGLKPALLLVIFNSR